MKKQSVLYKAICVLLLGILLAGCARLTPPETEHSAITPVGTVPTAFESIIKENLFADATAFADCLLKWEHTEQGYLISMYGFDGVLLAQSSITADIENLSVTALCATSDGGFLFGLGFYDHYNADEQSWASESGVYSRIVKCDASGQTEWDITLDNYAGGMLDTCLELDGAYYFFGEQETPKTATLGVYSPTDIHITKLGLDGTVVKTAIVAGSDYDSLHNVKVQDGMFLLYCRSQSVDGDFSNASYDVSGEWEITVSTSLELLQMQEIEYTYESYIGILDGRCITDEDKLFADFEDGRVTALVDYGEFYVVVSENVTGIYENTPPTISALWCYTETVCGAYDKQGDLLWKTAVDSSPPYDQMVEKFYS